jgi:chromosome segregation ATPase
MIEKIEELLSLTAKTNKLVAEIQDLIRRSQSTFIDNMDRSNNGQNLETEITQLKMNLVRAAEEVAELSATNRAITDEKSSLELQIRHLKNEKEASLSTQHSANMNKDEEYLVIENEQLRTNLSTVNEELLKKTEELNRLKRRSGHRKPTEEQAQISKFQDAAADNKSQIRALGAKVNRSLDEVEQRVRTTGGYYRSPTSR